MAANPSPSNSNSSATPTTAARIRNLLIVLVAVILSTAVFLGFQTQTGATSLSTLAEDAIPLETALRNQKPTLMEFYANWCTSCQAMADDLTELKQAYGDRVNFVMLNVDNSKWLPEMLHYRVDGIPHFIFLDGAGEAVASAIGEQPRLIMAGNLDALIADAPLPHAQARGATSDVTAPAVPQASQADPRSHGSQVVSTSASAS